MIKRPKRGESEDDLLRFQEEFFASQEKASVVVKRSKKADNGDEVIGDKANGDECGNLEDDAYSSRDVVSMEDNTEDTVEKLSCPMQFPNDEMKKFKIRDIDMDPRQCLDAKDKEHVEEILTNIKEKEISSLFNFSASCYKNGFPSAPVIDKKSVTMTTGKKKSLFAQQYSSFNEQKDLGKQCDINPAMGGTKKKINKQTIGNNFPTVTKDIVENDITFCKDFPSSSRNGASKKEYDIPISNSDKLDVMKNEVHKENMQKMNNMSEEDILNERKRLLSALDPKLIQFMQSRNKGSLNSTHDDGNQEMPIINNENETILNEENTNSVEEMEQDVLGAGASIRNVDTNDCDLGDEGQVNNTAKESYLEANSKQDVVTGVSNETEDKGESELNEELISKKGYVNMDVVEKEKLAWMKDIPSIEMKDSNVVPRFDFEGMLIDPNVEIVPSVGLHHHGEEPGLPGYNLQELFRLSRSNFPKQRIFSLELLGKIFCMYHKQKFVGKLTADLLTTCLDAGLIFVLRWSLDEQTEQVYSAAVAAIANVVYVKSDQDLVESYLFTENGYAVPALCTYQRKKDEDEPDPTDAQVVQVDLIKGLVQIQIIPRLRYIIDSPTSSETAIINCLSILIRMSQHDSETVQHVFKHDHLINSLFQLAKSSEECKQSAKVYALQLLRCLCQASKSISHELVEKYKLQEQICFLFSSSQASLLYSSGGVYVQVCHIWTVLLHYGILSELVKDLYSVLMSNLQQFSSSYKNLGDKMLASLINLLRAAIICTSKGNMDWSLIEGFIPVVYHILKLIQKDMFTEKKVIHPFFISSLLRLCGTYYQYKNTKINDVNPVTLLDEVEKFWNEIINPFVNSPLLPKLLEELILYSDFKTFQADHELAPKNPENLPSFGTYCLLGNDPPSLSINSSNVIVQGFVKLVWQLSKINKVLITRAATIVTAPETMAYIKFLLDSGQLKRCSILLSTRVEIFIMCYLVRLFHLVGNALGFIRFGQMTLNAIQEITIQLLCYLLKDDIQMVNILMKNIVFNPKIFRKQDYVLWLSEYWEHDLDKVLKEQLKTIRKDLQYIGTMYEGMLVSEELKKKKNIERTSLLLPNLQTKALPSDWMFYPIVHFFNTSVNVEQSGAVISTGSPEIIKFLKLCLQFVLMVETTRPKLVVNIPETIRLTRLSCLFLTEGQLFNEQPLKDLITSISAIYSAPSFQSYLNFELTIPGITSFIDFYKSLIGMYNSTSFGDHGFANILLFPLQLKHDVKYRMLIWTDFADILRVFPLPLNQVICDIKRFLAEENEDLEMNRLYFQALKNGTVKHNWSPLFYLIAVHHVNHFIFSVPSDEESVCSADVVKERSLILNTILDMSEKELREDIILYKSFDINKTHGIGKFLQLPPSRELFIRRLKGKED